jgi:DNA-binding transcriptional MerR regulator
MPDEQYVPIGYVSRLSGLSPHVIRAWERRYRAVTPNRSEGRHRLYRLSDLTRLKLLKQAVEGGHRISQIAHLDAASLSSLAHSAKMEYSYVILDEPESHDDSHYIQLGLSHVEALNSRGLSKTIEQAAIALPLLNLMEDVLSPLLSIIGEQWQTGRMRIVHEHMATSLIQAFLQERLYSLNPKVPLAHIAMATPRGQQCSLGLLMAAVLAASHGWQVHYFGADLPAEELAAAALAKQVHAVAISIVCHDGGTGTVGEIGKLSRALKGKSRLFLGGRATNTLDMGMFDDTVVRFGGLSQFSGILADPTSDTEDHS